MNVQLNSEISTDQVREMQGSTKHQKDNLFLLCFRKLVFWSFLLCWNQIQTKVVCEPVEKLLVKEEPGLYHFINQGCLGVDGMDDQEEMRLTDVRTV